MTAELKTFINQYVRLGETELDDIVNRFRRRKVKKNDLLLKEGAVCKDLIFVQEGCLRLYYIANERKLCAVCSPRK